MTGMHGSGWLTVGPDLSNSNYDWSLHQSFFSDSLTTGCTDRIEQLRPKSPPPKSGARPGRGGGGGGKKRGGREGRGGRGARPRD